MASPRGPGLGPRRAVTATTARSSASSSLSSPALVRRSAAAISR